MTDGFGSESEASGAALHAEPDHLATSIELRSAMHAIDRCQGLTDGEKGE